MHAHIWPGLDDLTHGLVTHDGSHVEAYLATEVRVQVRAADSGDGDAHDDVGIGDELRIANVLVGELFDSLKRDRLHGRASVMIRRERSPSMSGLPAT